MYTKSDYIIRDLQIQSERVFAHSANKQLINACTYKKTIQFQIYKRSETRHTFRKHFLCCVAFFCCSAVFVWRVCFASWLNFSSAMPFFIQHVFGLKTYQMKNIPLASTVRCSYSATPAILSRAVSILSKVLWGLRRIPIVPKCAVPLHCIRWNILCIAYHSHETSTNLSINLHFLA